MELGEYASSLNDDPPARRDKAKKLLTFLLYQGSFDMVKYFLPRLRGHIKHLTLLNGQFSLYYYSQEVKSLSKIFWDCSQLEDNIILTEYPYLSRLRNHNHINELPEEKRIPSFLSIFL